MRIWIVLLLLVLTGCQTTEDRIAQDDRQCKSYGAKPGDPAYMQCRMNLDTNRANVKAAERFGTGGAGLIDRIAGTAKE